MKELESATISRVENLLKAKDYRVEVKLIPIEYEYFIPRYGMRREDYPLVFPHEEVKSIKLQPKGLEQELFVVDLTDLKGGREYIILASAEDIAEKQRIEEIRTPYIRQFENIAPLDKITVGALYLLWWGKDNNWKDYKGSDFSL